MNVWFRLAALPLLLVTASCSIDAPVDPAAVTQYNLEAGKLDQLARYKLGIPNLDVGVALKTIGLEGGTIALAGFEVVVPPGAVSAATVFTIRIPLDESTGEFVRAHFGPHGTFNQAVTIRLPWKGTTAEDSPNARVLWWSESGWVPLTTQITGDGRLEAQTTHFSEYGTEDSNNKGVILGNRPCGRSCAK
jgi:hypothetical protein